jgi:opacity protein-like surface antigen
MKHFLLALIFTFSSFSIAQAIDSVKAEEEIKAEVPQNNPTGESKWYYGGTIGFSFWNDYTYIGIYPLVGYKVTPKFSIGGKIGYSYYNYHDTDLSTHNYGGSVFTRYRVIPQFYLHGEFVYFSYEQQTYDLETREYGTDRNWVPYLLLGGGFSQNVGQNVWAYVEILFDVLQDENSPYEEWEPFISIGVGVGF